MAREFVSPHRTLHFITGNFTYQEGLLIVPPYTEELKVIFVASTFNVILKTQRAKVAF